MHGRASRPEPRTPREIAQAILASQQMIQETYCNPEEFSLAGWSAESARAYHVRRIRLLQQRMRSVEGSDGGRYVTHDHIPFTLLIWLLIAGILLLSVQGIALVLWLRYQWMHRPS